MPTAHFSFISIGKDGMERRCVRSAPEGNVKGWLHGRDWVWPRPPPQQENSNSSDNTAKYCSRAPFPYNHRACLTHYRVVHDAFDDGRIPAIALLNELREKAPSCRLPSEVNYSPRRALAYTGAQLPLSVTCIIIAGTIGSWLGARSCIGPRFVPPAANSCSTASLSS